MSRKLNLHLIQWRIVPGEIKENLDKAANMISSAEPGQGSMILLPEMFPSGFYYENLAKMADEYETVVQWMGAMASRYGSGVAGSMAVHRPDGVANTMVVVDETGHIVAVYDKIHLFYVADEDKHFTPGRGTEVAAWHGTVLGLAICFDLRFPEMTRTLCESGAKVVLVSAQWPKARVDHFRDFIRVRAMENQMFIASCNSCGDDGKGLALGGGSTVVGPSGEVKDVLGQEEAVLTVSIDLDEVEHIRESFPVLKVRRRDIFGD